MVKMYKFKGQQQDIKVQYLIKPSQNNIDFHIVSTQSDVWYRKANVKKKRVIKILILIYTEVVFIQNQSRNWSFPVRISGFMGSISHNKMTIVFTFRLNVNLVIRLQLISNTIMLVGGAALLELTTGVRITNTCGKNHQLFL